MCITYQQNFPKVIVGAHGSSTAKNGGTGGEQGCGQPPPPDRVPAVRSCRCASGSFGRTLGVSHPGLTPEEEMAKAALSAFARHHRRVPWVLGVLGVCLFVLLRCVIIVAKRIFQMVV